jgi:glycosyltransferase involved in cell wall biosynthesis
MPQVSVVIALYNKAAYIRRALDSVLAQTYQDYEILVIDDGSTDDGPVIVASYHDPRLRLIRQENTGPGAARNRGMRESTSPYVTFLDADDEWRPEFLQTNVSIVTAHPEVEVVTSSWYQDVRWDGRKNVSMLEYHQSLGIQPGVWRLRPDLPDDELKQMVALFLVGVVFCRRQALESCGGFYAKNGCRFMEDTYLWLYLVCTCTVYRNLQPLMYYHNAASELAVGGYRTRPLEPYMVDPDPVRQYCPAANRDVLERWLARFALTNAHNRLTVGKMDEVRLLVRQFPRMKAWRWEYAKLRIKMMCPQGIALARAVRRPAPKRG